MLNKRRFKRRPVNIDIEFKLIEVEFGYIKRVEAKGTILDISETGFGMMTDHPLQKGHVVFINKNDGNPDVPEFGLTRWVQETEGTYRAGFSYRYLNK